MATADDPGAGTEASMSSGDRPQRTPPPAPIVVGKSGSAQSQHSRRRAPAGSVPGTLAIPSDALPVEMRAIGYQGERYDEREIEDLGEVRSLVEAGGVLWLDVSGFGDGSELSQLGELLHIHPLALADVVHTQRPKFESFGDRHLVVLQMGRPGVGLHVDLEQVTLILGPTWLVSFQERPGDVFDPVRDRLRHGLGALRDSGPDYLAYALIDAIVDGFFPVLERLGDQMDDLEEKALATRDSASVQDIHAPRRLLIRLHRALWGQRAAISAMLRDDQSPFGPAVHLFLRDTYDHSVQLLDLVESSRELSTAIVEIHLSAVNNRMNEIMKTLTIMASIFIPLTFIAGVYGMNFRYMPELGWRWAYPVFWAAMTSIAAVLLLWFRRRGWLRRDVGS